MAVLQALPGYKLEDLMDMRIDSLQALQESLVRLSSREHPQVPGGLPATSPIGGVHFDGPPEDLDGLDDVMAKIRAGTYLPKGLNGG